MTLASTDIVRLNVGGVNFSVGLETLTSEKNCLLAHWFDPKIGSPPLLVDRNGAYFIDRDPTSFGIILNFLRLKRAGQLWEACLPKDPDRLALLTQEAEFFSLMPLKDQAIQLLHACTEKSEDTGYVQQFMTRSISCPMALTQPRTPNMDDSIISND